MGCARISGLQVSRIQGFRAVGTSCRTRLPLTFEHCTVRCVVADVLTWSGRRVGAASDGMATGPSGCWLPWRRLRTVSAGPTGDCCTPPPPVLRGYRYVSLRVYSSHMSSQCRSGLEILATVYAYFIHFAIVSSASCIGQSL